MEITHASNQHNIALRQMWDICFNDPAPFADWFFKEVYNPKNTLITLCDGQAVSALQMLPEQVLLQGHPCPTRTIAGVCTLPEHRGNGYVRQLINNAHQLFYDAGILLSCLVPFDSTFYSKFGYGIANTHYIYTGNTLSLSRVADNLEQTLSLNSDKYRIFTCSHIRDVYPIYRDFTAKNALRFLRDTDYCQQMVAVMGCKCSYIPHLGYVIYSFEKDNLSVHEIVYEDVTALCCLLGFLGQSHHGGSTFMIRSGEDVLLNRLMLECGAKVSQLTHVMGRVINLKKVLGILAEDFDDSVVITVSDPLIADNNGNFSISKRQVSTAAKTGIFMDIRLLSSLVCGFVRPSLVSLPHCLDGLFRGNGGFINDMLGW